MRYADFSELNRGYLLIFGRCSLQRYLRILQRIEDLCSSFAAVAFESESLSSNRVAREIAKSVLRDGRFQSYLALGGPVWLQQLINKEVVSIRS
ncbi:hypothetical protein Bca101_064601 [Brassica carinata]